MAQASTEKFGQNQIQYENFNWKYYDSTHFRVFFYRPNEKLAEHILDEAERDLSTIVQKMGGSLPRKLNIILYSTYSDYVQSNIGIDHTSDLNDADGGRLKVSGDNLPIYFTGNHVELKNQVKQGVAEVIKDNMLFGKNIKEIVKNAIKMNLPEWYTDGYVEYISKEWTPELETEVQNIIAVDTNKTFEGIAQKNRKVVGHSFWHFLEEKYGNRQVSNLLYLSRFKKKVSEAIAQAMQKPATEVYDEWREYYAIPADILTSENTFGRQLKTTLKTEFEGAYSQLSLSPNGTQLAYVLRKDGEWKIVIQETDLGDSKVLVEGGFKNLDDINDPNYPLIAWSPSGRYLATVYPIKNKTLLRLYNARTQRKENRIITRRKIERITGMCFTTDDRTLIFSGIKRGKSDIFKYNFRRNQVTNLTNDYYDDHSPSYVSSGSKTGVLFLSNRTDTVMNEEELASREYFNENYNIFYFNQKNRATLRQVTQSKDFITRPIQYGLDKFSYIQKVNGALVRKIITVENSPTGAVRFSTEGTNSLPFNVLKHEYIASNESLVEVIKKNGQYHVYNTKVKELEAYNATNGLQSVVPKTNTDKKEIADEEKYKNSAPYITTFDNEAVSETLKDMFTDEQESKKTEDNLVNPPKRRRKKRYKTTFNPKALSSSLDNTLLFTRYQSVAHNGGGYRYPNINGFISFELIDILEDQKLTGGIRVTPDLKGTSYFLQYANYKKRLDWKVTYFHQQNEQAYQAPFIAGAFAGKVSTEYAEGNVRYPFNRANSINLSTGFRYDKLRFLSTGSTTNELPNDNEYWSFMRFEYIYDNTINPLLNIRKGTRAKVFAEYQYRLNKSNTGFYGVGFDVRNYFPIFKNIIFASRGATGLSDGSAKLLYYLGGVDNPIRLSIDQGNTPNNLSEYAFQTTATNLRGYQLQAFNGSSYAVINEEIRVPIYNTFFKRPVKSAFLRNFQLVAFADMGVAWRGFLPLDKNINPTYTSQKGNIRATFRNEQDIMGIGYGVGARSKLLGYFLRLDVGWNIEPEDRKPMIHISMATDF